MKTPQLVVIILNFNTKVLLFECLKSLSLVKDKTNFDIIVVDNGSSDGSVSMVKKFFPDITCLQNRENLGFAKGNNTARNYISQKYILFLNTDTIVESKVFDSCISYMEKNKKIGALSCKLVMANGKIDKDVRRSFPTPWVAFTHFSGLDRIFPKSKFFSKYWYGYLSENMVHKVDVLQGAFFLTKKSVMDEVDWFSEEYFLDGEDIDLSWKIKQKGYELVYYPKVSIVHLKGFTKGKNKKNIKTNKQDRLKYVLAGINAMEIFYKKYLSSNYNFIINFMVYSGIKLLKAYRYLKVQLHYFWQ